jgi:fatty acid desaturase
MTCGPDGLHSTASIAVDRRPGATPKRRGSDYAELLHRVKGAGLLRQRPRSYAMRIVLTDLAFTAGVYAFVVLRDGWFQVAVAPLFALVWAQVAFLGHDAGHRQIFARRWVDTAFGLVHGNLLLGVSFSWWVRKHQRHHSHPNHLDLDPDLDIRLVAFTAQQARRRRGVARVCARYQGYLFFALLIGEAVHLRAASVRALMRRVPKALTGLEGLLLAAHLTGYVALLVAASTPARAVAFVLVHQGVFGLALGCAFAPNHKGMPLIAQGDRLDFLRRQVLTSRNIRGGWLVDFLLGGLNYQIEHHLFPNMPRPNLRAAQPLVRQFCLERGVTYTETTLVASYACALRHLHATGAATRT